MGSAQSVIQVPVEEGLFPEQGYSLATTIETEPVLKRFGFYVEHSLQAGSGRMMKTFQLKRRGPAVESTAVLKAAWILEQQAQTSSSSDPISELTSASWVEEQRLELQRIKKAVQHQSHVAPFSAWFLGDVKAAPRGILQHQSVTTDKLHPTMPCNVRPAYLLRPAVYTTLADRLASRPWLTTTEKLWITSQILQAVSDLHASGVVHGFLTTENIGLTSTGWVLLLDLASYKAQTALPDDDPSEYLYYFQPSSSTQQPQHEQYQHQSNSSSKTEKRCYLAPERFYTPTNSSESAAHQQQQQAPSTESSPRKGGLTPAMDVFSIGCVLTELFLNGERCLDLGDLMEYRRQNSASMPSSETTTSILTPTLQQRLNKIESSAVRAACKHMLAADPARRLTAAAYWERLQAAGQFPGSFPVLTALVERMVQRRVTTTKVTTVTGSSTETKTATSSRNDSLPSASSDPSSQQQPWLTTTSISTPDARIALAVSEYGKVLWETMGIRDPIGEAYFAKALGLTMSGTPTSSGGSASNMDNVDDGGGEEKKDSEMEGVLGSEERTEFLLAQVQSLLKELDSNLDVENMDDAAEDAVNSKQRKDTGAASVDAAEFEPEHRVERSALCRSSLLIFLQVVLSTVRHAQRPASKLVALQLIDRLARYSSDETRLQRIVPVAVSLLQDQDPLVRASAVQVLTATMSIIQAFPPSDSKVFPQYIFKRVAHMISDPTLVVRLSFARCIATLAETAHRFLDISHAVRLYEAVGNGTSSGTASRDETAGREEEKGQQLFGDDVAKLLDSDSRTSSRVSLTTTDQTEASADSTMSVEGANVIAGKTLINSTYNAELSGLHETVSRWVVHVMTDQSEHSSLQKRALLGDVGRLCAFFGFEGVMSFILPQILAFLNERKDWELRASLFEHLPAVCHSIGRAATEEFVLPCVEIGLVDSEERVVCCALSCMSRIVDMGLLSRSSMIGYVPRRDPTPGSQSMLAKYGALLLHPFEDVRHNAIEAFAIICENIGPPDCDVYVIPLLQPFFRFHPPSNYLNSGSGMKRCLKPHWTRAKWNESLKEIISSEKNGLWTAGAWTSIGGVMVSDDNEKPTQTAAAEAATDTGESPSDPEEDSVRDYLRMLVRHRTQSSVQDRSLADKSSSGLLNGIEGSAKLAQSIMFPRQNGRYKNAVLPSWYASLRETAESTCSTVSEATSIRSVSTLGHIYGLSIMGPAEGTTDSIVGAADDSQSSEADGDNVLSSPESKIIQAAFHGEWGSEIGLDPDIVDTCLLVTKLKALGVPPLPVKLGDPVFSSPTVFRGPSVRDNSAIAGFRPSWKSLVATSSTNAHTAPVVRLAVSVDKNFFTSGSHDGTCRVWEVAKMEESSGLLESSITYSDHSDGGPTRINDVAMIEGTHSVVSGDSSGSVHVWRVDMVTAGGKSTHHVEKGRSVERPRAVGSTSIRKIDPQEGEVLAVSHFNSSSASVITFATQRGVVHSWDLRCASEPFQLCHSPDLGHLSSMALGSDRNWIVTGTSKGYLALWDIRFQQCMNLWRHSRGAPISRLATSSTPPPQTWGSPSKSPNVSRPYIFVAAGSNECAMFDALSGTCSECFRTVVGDSRNLNSHVEDPPSLTEVAISPRSRRGKLKPAYDECSAPYISPVASINCMVGSIGASSHSYLITGGSDCRIRFWDFSTPSKCFVVSGLSQTQSRPSYERIDFEGSRRLMLCRQSQNQGLRDTNKLPRKIFHGLKKPEHNHTDSIQDIKVIDNSALVSCSRDSTVKVWR